MQIRTQRLTLRPPKPSDAARVSRLAGEFDVACMTGMIPYPYEEGEARAWLERAGGGAELLATAACSRSSGAVP